MKFGIRIGKSILAVVVAACALGTAASDAKAQLIAYEGFDYSPPGNSLDTYAGGGTGWIGNWTRDIGVWTVAAPSMTYTAPDGTLVVSGGKVTSNLAQSRRSYNLPGGRLGNTPGTLWVSMLAQQTAGNTANNFGGFRLPTGPGTFLYFGKPFNSPTWGIDGGPGTSIRNSTVPTSQAAFLVLRIDFRAGADDVYMWVNPSLTSEPSTASAAITALAYNNFQDIDLAFLEVGSNNSPLTFDADEIRLGRRYVDVAPHISFPVTVEPLGEIVDGYTLRCNTLPPTGGVKWFALGLPDRAHYQDLTFLDIDTEGSRADVKIALYNVFTANLATPTSIDDDDGSGTNAQLSFGTPLRAALFDGRDYNARDGVLDAGAYIIGVAPHGWGFGPNYSVIPGPPSGGDFCLKIGTNVNGMIPGSYPRPRELAADFGCIHIRSGTGVVTASIPAHELRWYKFAVSPVASPAFLDIDFSTTGPGIDAQALLFDAYGVLIANSDDAASGYPLPQFSFGNPSPRPRGQPRAPDFTGQDGALSGGCYYLAVGMFEIQNHRPNCFQAIPTATNGGVVSFSIRSNAPTEPPCPACFDCDDEEAQFDAEGRLVLRPGERVDGPIVDEPLTLVGNVRDLYPGYDTSLDTWRECVPCDDSIGGEVPLDGEYGLNRLQTKIRDALIRAEIPVTPDEVTTVLERTEEEVYNITVNEVDDLPTAGPFSPNYAPPIEPYCPDPNEKYVFGGRDIVFVHGYRMDPMIDKILYRCDAFTEWPAQRDAFYDNRDSGGGYGYWKEGADNYWAQHIDQFLTKRGFKNRYLIVAYPSTQRLRVGVEAVLTQIAEAMRTGRGVVDPLANERGYTSEARTKKNFGTRSYVVVSHSQGALCTDIAMSAASRFSNLNVGFVADQCKAHISYNGAYSGSRVASAVFTFTQKIGSLTLPSPGPPWACKLANLILRAFKFEICGQQLELDLCNVLSPLEHIKDTFANSTTVDMIPTVAALRWRGYHDTNPVPSLTAAGGHPTFGGLDDNLVVEILHPVVKHLLVKGFDDGAPDTLGQAGHASFPISLGPLLGPPHPPRYIPKFPWFPPYFPNVLLAPRVFDMGIIGARAIDFYADQLYDPMHNQANFFGVAAGVIEDYSPTGMVQPVWLKYPSSALRISLSSKSRYNNHFSFIQSTADHWSGSNYVNGPPGNGLTGNRGYSQTYNTFNNDEDVRVFTADFVYQAYSRGIWSDSAPLFKTEPPVSEFRRSRYIPLFGGRRKLYIWKRTYNLLEGWENNCQIDYMHSYVLTTPADPNCVPVCPSVFVDHFSAGDSGAPVSACNAGWQQIPGSVRCSDEVSDGYEGQLRMFGQPYNELGFEGVSHDFPPVQGGRWIFDARILLTSFWTHELSLQLLDQSGPLLFISVAPTFRGNPLPPPSLIVNNQLVPNNAYTIPQNSYIPIRAVVDLTNDTVDVVWNGVTVAQGRPLLHSGPNTHQMNGVALRCSKVPYLAFDHDVAVYIDDIAIYPVCDPDGCPADFDDGSGTGTPDGGVTIDDLLYYLAIYTEGIVSADIDDGSGTGTPDGGVTIDDLLYYLQRYAAGC